MRMRKLVLDLSVAQIFPEKINKKILPKKLGFIGVLSTVAYRIQGTVIEGVEKVKMTFLTFLYLGMGKLMVKIFLMNSMKIIGFCSLKWNCFAGS